MSAATKIWFQDKDHAVGTLGPLVVQVWRGPNTYRNWRGESTPVFMHVDQSAPKGCCVLIIVEETASPPNAEARRDVDELARERRGKILASHIVSYGPPVRNTVVRTLTTAINLFSG